MQESDFEQVLEAFRRTARGAVEIGCDAVEIHGAHGYLLDSFLTPGTNPREDEYGGPEENRMRFPLAVVRVVRNAVGAGFPVIYRFSQWPTQTPEEIKFHGSDDLGRWVRALRDAGVDILHASTVDAVAPAFPEEGEQSLAAWTRKLSGLPVIAVGKISVGLPMDQAYGEEGSGVTDPEPAIRSVEAGEIDLLAVGRALIPNPDWVPLVRSGRWRDLKPFHKTQLQSLD
jgi:2,4-dienoyl-CoA reductase-like NADH-dependent reductase (Old Yellow Enzyme family)